MVGGGLGARAHASTPKGFPTGITADAPTALLLLEERTRFVFYAAAESVAYSTRVRLHNPGGAARFPLQLGFKNTEVRVEEQPPAYEVRLDGKPLASSIEGKSCGEGGFTHPSEWIVHFPAEIAAGADATIEARATFALVNDPCSGVDYQVDWELDESAFDIARADRTIVFTFEPRRSPLGVFAQPFGAIFTDGGIEWHWVGAAPDRFFYIGLVDYPDRKHVEWFPARYVFSGYVWDREHLSFWADCSIEEIEYAAEPGAPDTMTAGIREWIAGNRGRAERTLREIAAHHASVDSLNPVELRNQEAARSALEALDVTKRPSEILKALGHQLP